MAKIAVLEKLSTIKNQKLKAFSVNLNISILKIEIDLLKKNRKLSKEDAAVMLELLDLIKGKI